MSCYREAMEVWQEYKDKMGVDCDKLQRIHALENLAALLKESPEHACREFLPEDTAEPEAEAEASESEIVDSKVDPETLLTLKSQKLLEEVNLSSWQPFDLVDRSFCLPH